MHTKLRLVALKVTASFHIRTTLGANVRLLAKEYTKFFIMLHNISSPMMMGTEILCLHDRTAARS